MQYDNFGLFIKSKRERMYPELSLNEFALNIGVDSSTLSKIENQKQGMNKNTMVKFACGFNMLLSDFIREYELSDYSR